MALGSVGLAIVALLLWLSYTVVYRLLFHPLAKIPGPKLAAATNWYAAYFDCFYKGGGQYPFKIKELHEQYGPIIRISPDQLHISDPDYLSTIYPTKGRDAVTGKGLMADGSVGFAKEYSLHKLRRDAMNPYFSMKAVAEQESVLVGKTNGLRAILDEVAKSSAVTNMSDVLYAYSNDVLRSFCVGYDDDLLHDLPEAKRQRENLRVFTKGVNFANHFNALIKTLTALMVKLRGPEVLPPALRTLIAFRKQVRRDIDAIFEGGSSAAKKSGRNIFSELKESPILPTHEKSADRLLDEATLFVMAGTESPASTMGIAAFHLADKPDVMQRLRGELRQAGSESGKAALSTSTLLSLPYLQAVILEANRLSLGITIRMKRQAPTETLTYTASYGPDKGEAYVLPPKTIMSTLTWYTHTNEELFPGPLRFDPDRWLGDSEEVQKRKRCMHSFGKGDRRCVGINVANAEMSLAIAALAEYELELYQTDERDIAFMSDFQVAHHKPGSKGVQVVVKKRAS